ncbi:hypothetical protein HYV21_00120 [Candidatus Microgenomates bacterium]|nr:hypothetical protein [Candidatus Microgenomates bacterium]
MAEQEEDLPLQSESGKVFSENYKGRTHQFFATNRVDGKLDLSSIDYKSLPYTARQLFNLYQLNIKQWGDNALTHLSLPYGTHSALRRNGIETITQLEETIGKDQQLSNYLILIGPKRELEIKTALEELHELRSKNSGNTSPNQQSSA